MDKLKEYITRHRADFDAGNLPEGHLERFRTKLENALPDAKPEGKEANRPAAAEPDGCGVPPAAGTRPNQVRLLSLWISFAAAAAVAILCLLRLPGGTRLPSAPPAESQAQTCQAKQEFEELHIYYTMQINDMMARINDLYKEEKTPGGAELLKETKKILHDNYMFEETVLPTLPCSNRGLYAMNQHYSNSLGSLSIMLREMERVSGGE